MDLRRLSLCAKCSAVLSRCRAVAVGRDDRSVDELPCGELSPHS
jgi:hypothetical protein